MRVFGYWLPFCLAFSSHLLAFTLSFHGSDSFLPVRQGRTAFSSSYSPPASGVEIKLVSPAVSSSSSFLPARSPRRSSKCSDSRPEQSAPAKRPSKEALREVLPAAEKVGHDAKESVASDAFLSHDGAISDIRIEGLLAPRYPKAARRKGQQGSVVYRVVVKPCGAVASIDRVRSSGYRELDLAALRALEQAHFIPARRAGASVLSEKKLAFRFTLEDD